MLPWTRTSRDSDSPLGLPYGRLTPGSREHQGVLTTVQFCNFCAICALEMRFVALDSSSFVMNFRTKQHSKRSGFRPSVRCEVGGLRGKITAEYNGEGPKLKFPRSRIQFRGCYGKMNQEFDRMLGEGDFLIFIPPPLVGEM